MIGALAVRMAATRALTGRTIAGDRVYDSAISQIDDLMQQDAAPFVVVSSEDIIAKDVEARDLLSADRTIELVIEIAIGSAVAVPDPDGGGAEIVIPHQDAATALSVDLLSRQVMRELAEGGGAWGDVFRTLVPDIRSLKVRRGASAENGVRFAAAQIGLTVSPLMEPEWGVAPGASTGYGRFLAQVRADIGDAMADAIERVIVGTAIPEWRRLWTALCLTDEEARGIALTSVVDPAEEPADVTEIEAGGLSVEIGTIAANLPGDEP